jgi:acyl-CoA reductase-like NAD-dependent aldehyde dehydrogenase
MSFRLTYATMFNPPESMHQAFDAALGNMQTHLGRRHELFIDGCDVPAQQYQRLLSPIDSDVILGEFALATQADLERAMQAAQRAYLSWRNLPMHTRVAHLRRVADVMEARVYDIAAALSWEVGKNRMEALGEAQETVDFFRQYADDFEQAKGFDVVLPNDPLEGIESTNRSVLRPYGVWAVIAPFNFPLALMGGPTAAALVTGNVVIAKGSSNTPWAGRLLADCIRDAGLPDGVFQYLNGSSAEVGQALSEHPHTAGITFTGSVAVGKKLLQHCVSGAYPKPCIAEMGGKNACIVTEHADIEAAASGIVRSAYGLSGQKCSALSRLYVHEAVAEALIHVLKQKISAITIGNPVTRSVWLGPVNNAAAYKNYQHFVQQLKDAGALLHSGGDVLTVDEQARGYYVTPVLAEAELDNILWQDELFLPILMLHRVANKEQAMALANASNVGLTAGFYGAADEVPWFQEHIEAGVTYANRAQGATTGAWPGYQPFGGWKGSGSTGKAIASFYYLPLYMREQSRTVVR